jgi:tetratricopeptide (TPR) repeat protein
MANCYAVCGRLDDAKKAWDESVSEYSYFNYGGVIQWLKEHDCPEGVRTVIEREIERKPNDRNIYKLAADHYLTSGAKEESINVFRNHYDKLSSKNKKDIIKDITDFLVQHNLIDLYLDTCDFQSNEIDRKLLVDVFNRKTHNKEKINEARLLANNIKIEHYADDAEALLSIAGSYLNMDKEKPIMVKMRGQPFSDDPEVFKAVNRDFHSKIEQQKAIEIYQKVMDMDASAAKHKNSAAIGLIKLEQKDEALPYLLEYAESHPQELIDNRPMFDAIVKNISQETLDSILAVIKAKCVYPTHTKYFAALAKFLRGDKEKGLQELKGICGDNTLKASHLRSIADMFIQEKMENSAVGVLEMLGDRGFKADVRLAAQSDLIDIYLKQENFDLVMEYYIRMFPEFHNEKALDAIDKILHAVTPDNIDQLRKAIHNRVQLDPAHDRVSVLLGYLYQLEKMHEESVNINSMIENLKLSTTEKDETLAWGDLIESWDIAGPYEFESYRDIDKVFAPEKALQKTDGNLDDVIEWKKIDPKDSLGLIRLDRFFDMKEDKDKQNKAAYAKTTIVSPEDRTVYFSLGSDDWVKVWINGEEVHKNRSSRSLFMDQDLFSAQLKKGANEILLKVGNNTNEWGFCLRIDEGKEGVEISMN